MRPRHPWEATESLANTAGTSAPPSGIKRINHLTEEHLRKQLIRARELDLEAVPFTIQFLVRNGREFAESHEEEIKAGKRSPDFLLEMLPRRPDLAGLPVLQGNACRLDRKAAADLQVHSWKVRRKVAALEWIKCGVVEETDLRIDLSRVSAAVQNGKAHFRWKGSEGLPALLQLVMGEQKAARLFLVECLFQVKNKEGIAALARRALFDLDPGIREAALLGLKARPVADYRTILLDGLRYPWAPVAEHAAEALVALEMRDTVPDLVRILGEGDPLTPYQKMVGRKPVQVVRELVRVNHLRNCLLCHPPAVSQVDPLRGLIPSPNGSVPSPFEETYYENTNRGRGFIRADVTYLRQDFSVAQPVANPGQWPERQRYDYLVRERTLTPTQVAIYQRRNKGNKPPSPSKQERAILFALRELTGKDLGTSATAWKKLLPATAPGRLTSGAASRGPRSSPPPP
jgi:hypothetical protein